MSTNQGEFPEIANKMRQAGVSEAAIRAFRHSYENLVRGQTGLIAESDIEPVASLPHLKEISAEQPAAAELLPQTVILKLNGGLGTSMGLEKAKSLLEVKNGLTFLDFIARQVLQLREKHRVPLRFLLMNSFSTSRDTLEFLKRYPNLGASHPLEVLQSQAPKIDAQTLKPISWRENPQLEWCPPGHGDLYPSLLGSGLLDQFLAAGVKYMFVSNSDNLGATLDLSLLGYFAHSGKAFLMEVAERTVSDRKGGHLARRGQKLLLRESAQCPGADEPAFQDIARHRFFNTNNLWIRLDALRSYLSANDGFVPLPLIKNRKTVDPRLKSSPPVYQLETAMGAAIECFENTGAIVVPRTRFSPVKTTSDLLALRSDAYVVTDDWRLNLAPETGGQPPSLDLDSDHYRLVDQLDAALSEGLPSLKHCRELKVRGPVRFSASNILCGRVSITNTRPEPKPVPSGQHCDTSLQLQL